MPMVLGMRALLSLLTVALALMLISGCGMSVPADPAGTLDRVRGGTLRVGVSSNPPWTDTGPGTEVEPAGPEPELVRRFAAALDARVEWVNGGEEMLIGKLEHKELDLVIGGLTKDTPWSEKTAVTRPYTDSTATGDNAEHVWVAPMGENAFLFEIESFLINMEAGK